MGEHITSTTQIEQREQAQEERFKEEMLLNAPRSMADIATEAAEAARKQSTRP